MARMAFTPQQMRTKASQLREMNQNFRTQVGLLTTQEEELVGMWEGSTRDQFDKNYKSDRIQFDAFYQVIEFYAQTLEENATRYANAESESLQIVSRRS